MSDTTRLEDSSSEVLRHNSKSFSWAGVFLPKTSRPTIEKLYHFCRYCDDIADNLPPAKAHAELTILIDFLNQIKNRNHNDNILLFENSTSSLNPVLVEMVKCLVDSGIKPEWMIQLTLGLLSDQTQLTRETESDLLTYCYRVAGVVGLMMCPLIGVSDRRAYPYAVDLGIAMQLTNIARDVAEDGKMGRVYIPIEWLKAFKILPTHFIERSVPPRTAQTLVQKLLVLADRYYASASNGYHYIPARTRIAIMVASRLYRAIGTEIARHKFNPWSGRAHVTKGKKIFLTLFEISQFFLLPFYHTVFRKHPTVPHCKQLHIKIQTCARSSNDESTIHLY